MKLSRYYALGLLLAGLLLTAGPVWANDGIDALRGFGNAIVIGDGEVLVAESNTNTRPGTVYVYRKGDDGMWMEAAQLRASNAERGDRFGGRVALDGNTLMIGSTAQNNDIGAVYIFEKMDGMWTETGKIMPDDALTGDAFGSSIALAGDIAVVGAARQAENAGAAYVFRKGDNGWMQEGKLTAEEANENAMFGYSAVTDGEHVIIGAPGNRRTVGEVHAFRYVDGAWTSTGQLEVRSVEAGQQYGGALLLKDGMALASAPLYDTFIGAVFGFAFDEESGEWNQSGRLMAFDGQRGSQFGSSLDFDEANSTLWIGAQGADRTGRVYAFGLDSETMTWTGADKMSVEGLTGRAQFGATLAVSNGVAAISTLGADYGSGVATIFEWEDDMWVAKSEVASPPEGIDAITGDEVRCENGKAGLFDCESVDLVSFLPTSEMGGSRGVRLNDIWGWTDPDTGKEYALIGRMDGTSFVDVSNPNMPTYVGDLPMTEGSRANTWRDMKVYGDHMFVVADNAGQHGMQVMDLTKLRDFSGEPITFDEDAVYDGVASAHNVVINPDLGYAFIVGAGGGGETCGGGLHMVDISTPTEPTFAGCFADSNTGRRGTGYSHDAQCVIYDGPDTEHKDKQICFGSNETALSIADVTDKANPIALSYASYPNVAYSHQGWLSEDQKFFFMNDELDELGGNVTNTRTIIWDVSDLDQPELVREFLLSTESSDHNLYVKDNLMYQSNYQSGLRILDVSDPTEPKEVAHFDTEPFGDNGAGFNGTWSNYPYFKSGIIIVSGIGEGLFILRKSNVDI
ncbi:MAG: choice-of-anchor B family protein [Rhodothermales bacterium]